MVKTFVRACALLSVAALTSAAPQPVDRVIVVGDRARTTTEIPFSNGMTASKAIIAAGGYSDFSRTPIYLIRCGKPTALDMRAALELGEREKDVQLRPWDIIVIGTNLGPRR
jgi:protein involved in polysaccharide export with SLBB domain